MQQELRKYIPDQLKKRNQWIILNGENDLLSNQKSQESLQNNTQLELLSFEKACKIADSNSLDVLGFVMTKDDPFVAVIIKDCLNYQGELNQLGMEITNQINSYTEYDNDNLQIICEGILPSGNQNKPLYGIELLDNGILSLTGDAMYGNLQITDSTRELVQIYNKYFCGVEKLPNQKSAKPIPSKKGIIEYLSKMEQGSKLMDLFEGIWKPYYDSHLEADLALCTALGIATNNNKELVDATFRSSKLFRKSWDNEFYRGNTYGEIILREALNPSSKKDFIDNQRFLEPTDSLPPWYVTGDNGKLSFTPAVLAEHLSNTESIIYSNSKYYQYNKGIYKELTTQEVKSIIQRNLLKRHVKPTHLKDTEEFLKILSHHPDHILNGEASNHLINFKNGILNVYTKEFSPHTPQHLSSIQMDCYYDLSSEAPNFQTYLSQILDDDTLPLAQELLGYLLIPNTQAQKAFILYGPGRTGKSTFLQIIEMIIGNNNISNVSWQGLEDKFQPATLYGKLVNLFGDLPATSLKDTANFKALTGGDTINAQFKNQQIFSFKNKARLVFSCNQLPSNNVDRTDAFYRRIILIPFVNQVPSDQIDSNLIQKLKKEKDGIVQWALQGLYRLLKNDFKFSRSVVADQILDQYKMNNDSVLWFMKNYCELNFETRCYSQDLYNAYKSQCKMNGLQAKTQPQFNDDILKYSNGSVLKDKEGKTKRAIYRGISFQMS
ncbi:phage/plasmid primase, P4 family [Bacillus tuaregi]|uniref:phage/plasmid primase, P4 family n=1 Tax=Bacillus tuaregi TaxID=1816695 RepID=UPI0008F96A0D|nr:phage/plasmid primase, P4 family [Bacillus tuaregi]